MLSSAMDLEACMWSKEDHVLEVKMICPLCSKINCERVLLRNKDAYRLVMKVCREEKRDAYLCEF